MYSGGKSWNGSVWKTGSGKKILRDVILGASFAAQPHYVVIVMAVVHHCMGGLEVDHRLQSRLFTLERSSTDREKKSKLSFTVWLVQRSQRRSLSRATSSDAHSLLAHTDTTVMVDNEDLHDNRRSNLDVERRPFPH